MNLFQIKIRRFFNITIGAIFLMSLFSLIIYAFFSFLSKATILNVIGVSILSIVTCFLAFVLLAIIESKIKDCGYNSFMTGPLSISKRNKFVFHNELGYFLCLVFEDKIVVQEQKFLYMKDIIEIQNVGTGEQIARKIKSALDKEFKNKVEETLNKKRIKAQLEEVAKWDGFLDVESRRDEKIKRLIK